MIQKRLENLENPKIHELISIMNSPADISLKPNLQKYFFEFAKRRQLDTGIFPDSFF